MTTRRLRMIAIALLVIAMVIGLVRFAGLDGGHLSGIDTVGPGVVAMVALLIVLVAGMAGRRPQLADIGYAVLFWGSLLVLALLFYAFSDDLLTLLGAGPRP